MNITILSAYGDITKFYVDLSDNYVLISNSDNDSQLDNTYTLKDLVPHLESFKELTKVIEDYKNENMLNPGSKVAIPEATPSIINPQIDIRKVVQDMKQDYLVVIDKSVATNGERQVTLGINQNASYTANTFYVKDVKPYEGGDTK